MTPTATCDNDRIQPNLTTDALRTLYTPFVAEDLALAEEGMAEYAENLRREEGMSSWTHEQHALLDKASELLKHTNAQLDEVRAALLKTEQQADATIAALKARIARAMDIPAYDYRGTLESAVADNFARSNNAVRNMFRAALTEDKANE